MPVPYFYEAPLTINPTVYTLSEETSKHCVQVLRMKAGDRIDLTNGIGQLFEATISIADKKSTTVQIDAQKSMPPTTQKITLGISLLKNAATRMAFGKSHRNGRTYYCSLTMCAYHTRTF